MEKISAAATKKSGAIVSANKKSIAKNLHVVPHTNGWVIRSDGSTRVSSVHDTQREAIEAARALAARNAITLVIHGSDGRVKEWNSFTSDPKPPREPRKVLYPTTTPRTASRDAIKKAVSEAISEVTGKTKNKSKNSNGLVSASHSQRKPKVASKRDSRRGQVKA